jgi:SEC-C motif-containing protein
MKQDAAGCPCGRPQPLAACCGRYLADFDGTPSPDAEALMRSRYTAYVRRDEPYLLATWQASRRPSRVRFEAGTRWLGLEVRNHRVLDTDHAEVEFVARCRTDSGPATRLHERSRFVREAGRWYYVDGEHL